MCKVTHLRETFQLDSFIIPDEQGSKEMCGFLEQSIQMKRV